MHELKLCTHMSNFPEHDWKVFKEIHPRACERFCSRTLETIRALMEDKEKDPVDRFFDLQKLVKERGKEWNQVFSDWRRSTALLQLGAMYYRDLVGPEDFERLSPETRDHILSLAEVMRPEREE